MLLSLWSTSWIFPPLSPSFFTVDVALGFVTLCYQSQIPTGVRTTVKWCLPKQLAGGGETHIVIVNILCFLLWVKYIDETECSVLLSLFKGEGSNRWLITKILIVLATKKHEIEALTSIYQIIQFWIAVLTISSGSFPFPFRCSSWAG